MMPAAKHFDPVLGVDIHIVQPPGPVPPLPVPHPFVGFIFDPIEYIPITIPLPIPFVGVIPIPLYASIKINGMLRAIAGTMGKTVPGIHFPIGGTFVKPPSNECEMFMGSSTVNFDGDAASYMALPTLECQCIGMPPIPRLNAKKKSKVKSLVLPTGVVLPIPMGPPVLIGGAPTISLMALAFKAGFSALGKAMRMLKKSKFARKVKAKFKKKTPPHHKAKCRNGKPIDAITGAFVDKFLDHELPGEIPFVWKRYYDSRRHQTPSPLGWGFRHEYQRELRRVPGGFEYQNQEGDIVSFPPLEKGARGVAQDGMYLQQLEGGDYAIAEEGKPTMTFSLRGDRKWFPVRELRQAGYSIRFRYDDRDRLVEVIDTTSRRIRFLYDSDNHIRELRYVEADASGSSSDAIGRGRETKQERVLVSYRYDQRGCLISAKDALGSSSHYSFDANQRMTRNTDRRGMSFFNEYDEQGRSTREYGEHGLYDLRMEYYPESNCSVARYADGATITYYYDQDGIAREIVNEVGGRNVFDVSDDGRVVAEYDPLGNATVYEYNEWGGHVSRVDPLGNRFPPLDVEPNPPDPQAYVLPETPMQWVFGSLFTREEFQGGSESESLASQYPAPIYNAVLEAVAAQSPTKNYGGASRRNYDEMGRLIEEIDHSGYRQTWKYDAEGNILEHQDREDSVTRTAYTSWNLRSQIINPTGGITRFKYSIRSELTYLQDPGGAISEYKYDHRDRLIEVVRHGRVKERYQYDIADNLIAKTDGDNKPILSFEVGPGNLQTARHLSSGDTHSFSYDERGRVATATTHDTETVFGYDLLGRKVKDERDGQQIVHKFELDGLVSTTFFGKFIVVYELQENRTLLIRDPTGGLHQMKVQDRAVSRELANGTREFSLYDENGRCLINATVGDRDKVKFRRYRYSGEGELLEVVDHRGESTKYEYDASHRITGEISPKKGRQRFAYDPAGNLREKVGLKDVRLLEGNRLASANDEIFIYNDRNHVVSRSGKQRNHSYQYDSLDMLVACQIDGQSWSAKYDPIGRRISKTWKGETTQYYWDDFRLAVEMRADDSIRLYIYVNERSLVPFLFVEYEDVDADPSDGKLFYVFTNQVGAPTEVEDAQGNTVWQADIDPYGVAFIDPGSKIKMPLRFPGHYHDEETGLHYNRYRYYDPQLGRYLQSDPIGIVGGVNLYAYCPNHLTQVDIDGLSHPDSSGPNSASKKPDTVRNSELNPKTSGSVGRAVKKGDEIGEGAFKKVYKVDGDPSKVVAVSKAGDLDQIKKEFDDLKKLEEAGVPAVKVHEIVEVDGKPAILMDNYSGSTNIKPIATGADQAAEEAAMKRISQEGVEDLKKIKEFNQNNNIDDFQVLVTEDGRVLVADPMNITPNQPAGAYTNYLVDEMLGKAGGG